MDLLREEDRPYFKAAVDGRLTCTLTGHTLPFREEAVRAFTNGPRYRRLRGLAEEAAALRQYEPWLVQSRNFPDKLFCALTCLIVNKKRSSIEKHMQGRKYRKAMELHLGGKHALMEEPELQSSEASKSGRKSCKGVAARAVTAVEGPQEDQEAVDIVVTEARCAGGDEGFDAAAHSAPAEEAGMDMDAPVGCEALGGGALVIKAAAALDSRKPARVRPTRPKRIRR